MRGTRRSASSDEGIRFRSLHRKLEQAVAGIEHGDDLVGMIETLLHQLCDDCREELGIEGGRVYTLVDGDYVLSRGFGSSSHIPPGIKVPRDYPPHCRVLSDGLAIAARGDPGVDAEFEDRVGVRTAFAAFGCGDHTEHVISFSLKPGYREAEVLFALSLIRHVMNLKFRQKRMAGIVDGARLIQEGILPLQPPVFPGYEIASIFRPADIVSGDLFDYLTPEPGWLGVAIADSSGHGLPAALLARDVVTSLRTLAGQGLPPDRVVERVNRVISHAVLAGTFVSLFYVELQADGSIRYCNAGHELPLVAHGGGVRRLAAGGTVLGPFPAARYQLGEAVMEPGAHLILYTDGVPERPNRAGELYGLDRLENHARGLREESAADAAASVATTVDNFASGCPAQDDMTIVVLHRLPEATMPTSAAA